MKALNSLSLLALSGLLAAETTPMTMEEREASVLQLRENIEAREERLQEVVSDIRTLDERTEKRIQKIVDKLASLQDSQTSKTRITRLKGRAIAGLENSIKAYNTERRKIFERVRADKDAPKDVLSEDLDKIDARIQKRADQIMALAKTMPPRADVDKYEEDDAISYGFWTYETTRISEEWKQARRQGSATDTQLRELTKALEEAIESLERRCDTIRAKINGGGLTDSQKVLADNELARNEATLAARKRELAELGVADEPPTGTPADKSTADHLKEMLDQAREDIGEDHWMVLKKYNEAIKERDTLLRMKANLAAREKWLEEHAAE